VTHVAIRPEEIVLLSKAIAVNKANNLPGVVRGVMEYGFFSEVQVAVQKVIFRAVITNKTILEQGIREGEPVTISFEPNTVHTL